jgi:hypothetical protein
MRTNSGNDVVNNYKIYYKNSKAIGNICTVCLLFNEDKEVVSRGVAICSLKDIHRKATGRNIAIGRAIKAFVNNQSTGEIKSSREESFIIRDIKTNSSDFKEIMMDLKNYPFLSSKIITLNNHEFLRMLIPLGIPIWETKKLFNFKSEYKPVLTEEEKILTLIKKEK